MSVSSICHWSAKQQRSWRMLVSCWLTLTLLCKGSIANPTSSPYTSSYTSTQNGTQKEPTNTSREDNQTSAGTTTPPSVIPMSRNECSAGTYFSFKERTCIDCPRDSVSVAGSFSCTICSLGSFPNKERTACGKIWGNISIMIPIVLINSIKSEFHEVGMIRI